MKTIWEPACRQEILDRFEKFTSDRRPAWGSMTAAQTLAHLTDPMKTALGEIKTATMEDAIDVVERAVAAGGLPAADAVGYRVVHPGPNLRGHQLLTPEVLKELRAAYRTLIASKLNISDALAAIREMIASGGAGEHVVYLADFIASSERGIIK